ncbi:phage recombination protein Bet [Amycolatopsis sp. NPDC049253]|uniref:phage recombination protein Bet n=1 Tax=Amycolatopsis sp. NPDC049253 TaxID=3155274 RepID=UPI0034390C27
MTGKDMVARPAGSLALDPTQTGWTEVQRAALVQLGLDEAPDADLAVFLHFAQRTGLDPFARQIYMIARWDSQARRNKFTIQAAIDGLRIVAERHGQYGGQVGPEWCGPDGQWSDVWLKQAPPVAARVGIIRKDWSQVMYATAHFAEYAGFKSGGALTAMWQGKGALMIAKCAEALALRKAFPQDLSGVYTAEEMSQADAIQVESERAEAPAQAPRRAAPEPIDWDAALAEAEGNVDALKDLYKMARGVEPNNAALAERIAAAGKAAKAAADAAAEPVDAEVVEDVPAEAPEPRASEKQLTAIAAALGEHGVKEREDRLAVVSFLVGAPIGTTKNLARSEAAHVLDTVAKFAEAGQMADTVRDAIAAWTPGVAE